jgi:hypothetical protein
LDSDIPAGDGKLVNLFLRCTYYTRYPRLSLYLSFTLYQPLYSIPFPFVYYLPVFPCIFSCLSSLLYTYHSFFLFLFILCPSFQSFPISAPPPSSFLMPISPLSYIPTLYSSLSLCFLFYPFDAFLSSYIPSSFPFSPFSSSYLPDLISLS